MVEYVSLSDVKGYLGLSGTTEYDDKLNAIVDGINHDVSDYIDDQPVDAKIKLNVLRLCEYYWVKTTGAVSESEGSGGAYKIQFEETDGWPSDIKAVFDQYAEDGTDTTGETTLELI